MKSIFNKLNIALLLAVATIGMTSCSEKETPPVQSEEEGVVVLSGTRSDSLVLDASKKYLLKGYVYIQAPGSITIPAGTIIKGDKQSKGTLIIERGAKIYANGTSTNPIVFTSNEPAGQRSYGDWGGVIILGKSANNGGASVTIEGGVDRPYGGNIDADNSGVFKYVRIEFSGVALSPNNEINGLTLGSVGSGTTIDYVQVSYCGDDAYEWFGGSVNAKHLIAFRTVDDEFDTDNGYSGKVQFGVSLRDPNVSDVSTSNGFESDNDATGSLKNPQTSAVFSNMSLFGYYKTLADTATYTSSQIGRGAHIRRNTAMSLFNSVIVGYKEGIRLDSNITQANMTAGKLVLKNVTLASNYKQLNATGTAVLATFQSDFNAGANNNSLTDVASLMLNANNNNLSAPNFLPQAGSPLLSVGAADFTDSKLSGMENVSYRGAFGTIDWTASWTNFNPQNTPY